MTRSGNLCNEILEFSNEEEYACCTLSSLCLPMFVEETFEKSPQNKRNEGVKKFNFKKLAEVARVVIRNLNRVIDINDYPVVETKLSNLRHRPLGLGVQGLSGVYHKLKIAFTSDEAKQLNKLIFETIYYAAQTESCELARQEYFKYKKELKDNKTVDIVIGYKVENNDDVVEITKNYTLHTLQNKEGG